MSERFLKFIPSQEAMYLLTQKGHAFRLLTIIATRARRESGHPDGLLPGQCHIGDWENMGFSRQEYRTAKDILVLLKHIEIVETCRTRKKSTTGITTKGTLVKLISSNIYDINIVLDITTEHKQGRCKKSTIEATTEFTREKHHKSTTESTTDQPPTNHERRTNKKEEDVKETIIEEKLVRPLFRSSLLHEEDLNAMVLLTEANDRAVSIKDFTLWSKSIEMEEMIWVCKKMLEQKTIKKTPAATMQWMFTKRIYHENKREEANKAFCENLKHDYKLSSLTITKQYARDENTGYDFQFWWECDMFERVICDKFNINNEKIVAK